jgi:hypothetical protein
MSRCGVVIIVWNIWRIIEEGARDHAWGPEAGRNCVETRSPTRPAGPDTSGETNRSQYPGPQQEGEPPCSASLSRLTTI